LENPVSLKAPSRFDGDFVIYRGFCQMRLTPITFVLVLVAPSWLAWSPAGLTSHRSEALVSDELSYSSLISTYHAAQPLSRSGKDDQENGIKEEIPGKYAARYAEWKKEFLSTEAGRTQWSSYENNPNFTLTITISRENAEGATTGAYKWNSAGQLIAATITLGIRLDAGYPNPIYFPVMNSLVPTESSSRFDGNTLAATKIAHEFGHVNRTSKVDPQLYQLQSQLIPQYNKIFLSNGRNANDPQLIELERQLGGTPVEIWEDREYWGEANAMLYLRDRFTEDSLRCTIFNRIKHSVDLYAKSYESRFVEIAQTTPSTKTCGWK
jgi:YD repeat-containing protein